MAIVAPSSLKIGNQREIDGPLTMTKIISISALLILLAACAPTVKVEAPEKPITINLNVKVEHEIRVKVEKDLDQLISSDSELF